MKPHKIFPLRAIAALLCAVATCLSLLPRICNAAGALPSISAPGAIVIDRDTGALLGAKSPDTPRPIASLTKMMTALLVVERHPSLDTIVGPVSSYAASYGGNTMGLHAGDHVSIRDLLYGMLLPSGNDAAIALAEATSGTVDNFAVLMNQRAQSLGLTSTHYRHPAAFDRFPSQCDAQHAGQTSCGHYSTPRDLARLASVLLQNPVLAQIVRTVNWTPRAWYDASGNQRRDFLSNSNLLLSSIPYPGVNGLKTGQSEVAAWCMVASATRSNQSVITVVLGSFSANGDNLDFSTGSPGDLARHYDTIHLLDFSFANQAAAPVQQGAIAVNIGPAEAVAAGGRWKLGGSNTWLSSGSTASNLTRSRYRIVFSKIPGWVAPPKQAVTLSPGQTFATTASYSPQVGSIVVNIGPSAAVTAGALWRIDGGPWITSGARAGSIMVGSHTITFNSIGGWTSPPSQSVAVRPNKTASVSAQYRPNTGAP